MPENDAQKRYWQGVKERRSSSHPAVRAFVAPKLAIVREIIGGRGQTMLEVGAGNGYFSRYLMAEFDLTVVDFSDNMLRLNPLPSHRKLQGMAEALPLQDNSFDVVLCANLLHHVADPATAVREMSRVARRHVVLIEPNALNPAMLLFGIIKKAERGVIKFRPRYVRKLGLDAGMRVASFASHGAIVPNKTPAAFLPILRYFDRRHPLGFYHVAVFNA